MSETRAVAVLPNLSIDIRHRKPPDEAAEYLAITLRETPDLPTATNLLDPFGLLSMAAASNPWVAWLQLADPFRLCRAPTTPLPRGRTASE